MQDGSKSYYLDTGNKAAKRLDLQHELFFGDLSYTHLKKVGLSKGQTVFDIGCGSGAMTLHLAKEVGPEGHVYALDISDAQIEYARQKIKDAGFDNVTFIKADITNSKDLPANIADVIYIRMVLMHLKNPEDAIANMQSILKPGGVVASMEGYNQRSFSNEKSGVLKRVLDVMFNLKKHNGLDYNIAQKIEKVFEKSKFSHVESYEIEHKVSPKNSAFLAHMSFSEWNQKAVEANLIAMEEARDLEQELANSLESNKDSLGATLKCVIAKK